MRDVAATIAVCLEAWFEALSNASARFGERCLNNDFVYVGGLVMLGFLFGLLFGTQI